MPTTSYFAPPLHVALIGATGAVGGEALRTLLQDPQLAKVTTFGRRPNGGITHPVLTQNVTDIHDPSTYAGRLEGHDAAVCCLGVGEPRKVSRADFEAIDKTAVLAFAKTCRTEGVRHFELLSSVGASPSSRFFYLRLKGELIEELRALDFERLSIFQPAMILTPSNRYGASQAVALRVYPWLHPLMRGGLRKYRGVPVEFLGAAMTKNLGTPGAGFEVLTYADFVRVGMR